MKRVAMTEQEQIEKSLGESCVEAARYFDFIVDAKTLLES
jgi:hypothetical protein